MSLAATLLAFLMDDRTYLGLSEDSDYYLLTNVDEIGAVAQWWQKKSEGSVEDFLQKSVGFNQETASKFRLIRTIPYQSIWRKNYIIYAQPNSKALHQQVIRLLKQDMPLPLEDIFFDYNYNILESGRMWQITLFAIRKDYADSLKITEDTVLDCELECQKRARIFLGMPPDSGFVFDNKWINWGATGIEITPATAEQLALPYNFILPPDDDYLELYLSAVGAALWLGEHQ